MIGNFNEHNSAQFDGFKGNLQVRAFNLGRLV